MTKSELVEELVYQHPGMDPKQVEQAVQLIFDTICDALAQQLRIELRGFGAFSLKKRQSRTAHNPKTGKKVRVPPKYVPFFVVGKELKKRVNQNPKSSSLQMR